MAEKDRIKRETENIYSQYYTQQNDPAKAGSDAFRRAVASQLRQSYETQRQTGQSYSDLYQQARRQATRAGAMSDTSGFSGGMARGQSARMSAAEIQALSGIGAQRERAMRDIELQRQAIPSNALIEAQQADQYARAQQKLDLERYEQAVEVAGKVKAWDKLSASQKARLRALGIETELDFYRVTGRAQGLREANRQASIFSETEAERLQRERQEEIDALRGTDPRARQEEEEEE